MELPASSLRRSKTGPAGEFLKRLNVSPEGELLPGWQLTLDVTADGYWFIIKDKTDPCGLPFVSNQGGLIYNAEPLR